MDCCGVRMNNKVIFGKDLVRGERVLEGLYKRRKTNRFDVLFYIVAGIFIVLALRLFMLQILAGGYYQAKAEGNRLRMVPMTAARGIMYDRNGQILVGSRPAYTISIMPTGKALDDGEVAKLAALLKMKPEDIKRRLMITSMAMSQYVSLMIFQWT